MISNENKNTKITQTPQRLADSLFFKFYSELFYSLSKPVDLVDLKIDNAFTRMIRNEGIVIYA